MAATAVFAVLEQAVVESFRPPDVLAEVRRKLHESSYYFLRTVGCEFERGVLTLRGRVPSFYLKQLAQSLAARVAGVERVVNALEVCNPAGLA